MKQSTVTSIICTLCVLSTVIISFITYMDIDNSFSFGFILGYVVFIIVVSFYWIIKLISNIKKVKWFELRKRLLKFVGLFISFSAAIYIFNYMFRSSQIDMYDLSIPFAMALSLTFFDLFSFKESWQMVVNASYRKSNSIMFIFILLIKNLLLLLED